MINGWRFHYRLKPIFDGDFDYYKITFPLNTSKTTDKTTNKELEIVKILENNPHFTLEEVGKQMGLTINGIQYYVRNFKKTGKIEKIGGKKLVNGRCIKND